MVEAHTSIDKQLPERKKPVNAKSKAKLVSPPDQNLIRRSFIEKLCNTSTTTINKLMELSIRPLSYTMAVLNMRITQFLTLQRFSTKLIQTHLEKNRMLK